MRLWFGFDLLDAFRHVKAHAVEFNAAQGRPYALWVWHNLREFAFATGFCQIVLFWAALADGLRTPGGWRTRLDDAGDRRLPRPAGGTGRDRSDGGQPRRSHAPVDLPRVLLPDSGGLRLRPAAEPDRHHPIIALSALQAALGTAMIGFVGSALTAVAARHGPEEQLRPVSAGAHSSIRQPVAELELMGHDPRPRPQLLPQLRLELAVHARGQVQESRPSPPRDRP